MSYIDKASQSPYYDDFNSELNFLRVVFNPARAVQARELTQAQTILQNQISNLAGHLFRDGSLVYGGKISVDFRKPHLTIEPNYYDQNGNDTGIPVDAGALIGLEFTLFDTVNGVQDTSQKMKVQKNRVEAGTNTVIHLYYTRTGLDFSVGDILYSNGLYIKVATAPTEAIFAKCEPGIMYKDGYFVTIIEQTRVISDVPTGEYIIGYRVEDEIMTEEHPDYGNSLLDPANGTYNWNAPGAHRYRVIPILDGYEKSAAPDPATDEGEDFYKRFVSIVEFKDRVLIQDNSNPRYSDILDLLARRTYDESGNYTVKDFSIYLREPQTLTNVGEKNYGKLIATVSAGKAYVLGYEVEKQSATQIRIDRSLDTRLVTTGISDGSQSYYCILKLNPSDASQPDLATVGLGSLDPTSYQEIDFYQNSVGKIGTGRISSMERIGDEVRLYITEIKDFADEFANVDYISIPTLPNSKIYLQKDSSGKTILKGGPSALIQRINDTVFTKSVSDVTHDIVRTYTETATGTSITINTESSAFNFYDGANYAVISVSKANNNVDSAIALSSLNITYSPNQIVIDGLDNGVSYSAVIKQTVSATHRVKTLAEYTETITVPSGTDVAQLVKEDCYELVAVKQIGIAGSIVDRDVPIENFVFDSGQRDHYYGNGSISGFTSFDYGDANQDRTFEVTYKYFEHSAPNANQTYFSVDSYQSLSDELQNIGEYLSSNGVSYDLVNCLDFRVKLSEIQKSHKTVIPFKRISSIDYEEYLPRIDVVYIDYAGKIKVKKGIPSTYDLLAQPEPPKNAMPLFVLELAPYTGTVDSVKVTKIDNRRYTMQDIGLIDRRLKNVENLVSLNLLEKSATELSILDPNGLDKFKSGIFADPCVNHNMGNTADRSYRVVVDPTGGMRCPFNLYAVEYDVNSTTGVRVFKDIVTLEPAGEKVLCKNHFASGSVNVNPYLFYQWNGVVEIDPSVDTWVETKYLPNKTNFKVYDFTNKGPLNTNWNSWNDNVGGSQEQITENSVVSVNASSYQSVYVNPNGQSNYQVSLTTTTNPPQTIVKKYTKYNTKVDEKLVNTEQVFYARPIRINFTAKSMRQGMNCMVYLGGKPMNATFTTPDGKTDSEGTITGYFDIPEKTVLAGTSTFLIVDDEGTSSASTTFTASGTIETKQKTITTTKTVVTRTETIGGGSSCEITDISALGDDFDESDITANLVSEIERKTGCKYTDPIAQSFLVDSVGGAMLSSIEVFFKTKPGANDEQLPISLYIVEMDNGVPTSNIVPHSIVTKSASTVSAHDEYPQQGKTEFRFDNPVYLESDTEYAFVLFTNSDKYEVWISTLGEQDVFEYGTTVGAGSQVSAFKPSRELDASVINSFVPVEFSANRINFKSQEEYEQVTTGNAPKAASLDAKTTVGGKGKGIARQPYLGTLFKSQNSKTWTPEQMSDITFTVNQYYWNASGSIPATGYADFRDRKTDVMGVSHYTFTETFNGFNSDTINLSNSLAGLDETDIVITISGVVLDVTKYQITGDKQITLATIYNGDLTVSVKNDTGKRVDAIKCSTFKLSTGQIELPYTKIQWEHDFHIGNSIGTFKPISVDGNNFLNAEYQIDDNAGTTNNHTMRVNLETQNPNVSPVIDLQRVRGLHISNDVVNLGTGQYDAGTYLTRTISLANPADDIRVILDSYLPDNSKLNVLYRTTSVQPKYYPIDTNYSDSNLSGQDVNIYNVVSNSVNGSWAAFVTGSRQVPGTAEKRLYISAISDKTTLTTAIQGGGLIIVVPKAYSFASLPAWASGTAYNAGDYVIFDGKVWVSNDNNTAQPTEIGTAWDLVPSVFIDTANTYYGGTVGELQIDNSFADWRPMVLDSSNGANSNSAQSSFAEFTYVPEIEPNEEFTDFAIKVELISENTYNVPVFKNLRAIAAL